MLVTDPIADMLARIRNAMLAKHEHVSIPVVASSVVSLRFSKRRVSSAPPFGLSRKGAPQGRIDIKLKWDGREPIIDGLKRISKPGRRVYAGMTTSRISAAVWGRHCVDLPRCDDQQRR